MRPLLCLGLVVVSGLVACRGPAGRLGTRAQAASVADLLSPAPTEPLGDYDYMGQLLTPAEAAALARAHGLDPADPHSYARLGAVQITSDLIAAGAQIFATRRIGDTFGVQEVFGAGLGFAALVPELTAAVLALGGRPTTNLVIVLQKDLRIGSHLLPKGSSIPTGLDVEAGALAPVGLLAGNITCALCHASVDLESGRARMGVPNTDINIAAMIAMAPNTAAGFARLDRVALDPFATRFHRRHDGTHIVDSTGREVELPDPDAFEMAMDDLVYAVPLGNFESSPDGINDTTNIPSVFTFGQSHFGFAGEFAVGPFGGLAALNNAVHSSEINLLAAAQLSAQTLGIDPEVYLGIALQRAALPLLRLPSIDPRTGRPWRPSEWLRQVVARSPARAELESQVAAPGAGQYPHLSPSLLTFNGLLFSPAESVLDPAGGPFFYAALAMAAFQSSLVPPPNRTPANAAALASGSVARGAAVFARAGCPTCHPPPFFTDGRIHPLLDDTNPARARSRLALAGLLVPPRMYALDTPVPPPPDAAVIDLPTAGISATPTSLPDGLMPNGGYKSVSLRGLWASAPYLHDGGVAVNAGAIEDRGDGWYVPADPVGLDGLGLSASLVQSRGTVLPDAAASLRALVDRRLRAAVATANARDPDLVTDNISGTGHDFYVDEQAGYSPADQTDLVHFLLALDDDPGAY